MLPCRCTLLPPAARRPITGVIVTVRQARRWSATLLDRRTGLRQALHFWIGVYKTSPSARKVRPTVSFPVLSPWPKSNGVKGGPAFPGPPARYGRVKDFSAERQSSLATGR